MSSVVLKSVLGACAIVGSSAVCCCDNSDQGWSIAYYCNTDNSLSMYQWLGAGCTGSVTDMSNSVPAGTTCDGVPAAYVDASQCGTSDELSGITGCSWLDDDDVSFENTDTTTAVNDDSDGEGKCCCVSEVNGATYSAVNHCEDDQMWAESFMGSDCSGTPVYTSPPTDVSCSLVQSAMSEDGCAGNPSYSCTWLPGTGGSDGDDTTTGVATCECLGADCQTTSSKLGLPFSTLEDKYMCDCSGCADLTSEGPCDATECLGDTCRALAEKTGMSLTELEESYSCDCTGCQDPAKGAETEGCTWWNCE